MTELRTVLYVDDDDDVREVAEMALTMVAGLDACVCSSGREALVRFPDFQPDLLLLDVMMPEMDGPSTLAAIRANGIGASTPVVFMTAKVRPDELERYRELGAIGVIEKPFDPMTLGEQLAALWKERDVV